MISNEKEFWTVGYSAWGRWQVRKASVDTPDEYTVVEDLGPELTAAYLEADGDFKLAEGKEHLEFLSEGLPWLFVITTSGKLYVKRVAEDINNSILLATGVLQASPCRGWKSQEFDVDSGLAIAYRTASGVYVREYLPTDGTYTWMPEQEILNQPVENVEIRRMNDYRFGIYTINPNHIFLTERTYIGGTSKTEYAYVLSDTDFDVESFTSMSGPHDNFVVEAVSVNDGELWVRGNYPFYRRDNSWNDISIISNPPAGQSITGYRIEDGLLKITLAIPITSPLTYLALRIRAANRIQFERTPQSRPIVPQLDIIKQSAGFTFEENCAVSSAVHDWVFAVKERKTYQYALREYPKVTSSADYSFASALVGTLLADYEESALVTSTASWSFSETQTGDVPI